MPRRRNGRSRRDAVIYIHVRATTQEVIVEVLTEPILAVKTQNGSSSINCVDENVTVPQHSEGFDGIELHGDEFVFD